MTSRARNNFLPDNAGGEARSTVWALPRRPDKRCSARRIEFASAWRWLEPRPMAEEVWQTGEKRCRRDERRPAGPPRFPGRPFSAARWPGLAGRASRVPRGWRRARAARCGRRLTNQARSEPTTAGRFPNVWRRHQENASRPARGACAPGSFRADLRDGSLPNGPTIFAQSLRLRRRTSREFRAMLRMRPMVGRGKVSPRVRKRFCSARDGGRNGAGLGNAAGPEAGAPVTAVSGCAPRAMDGGAEEDQSQGSEAVLLCAGWRPKRVSFSRMVRREMPSQRAALA